MKKMDINKKREQEKKMVTQMIQVYCRNCKVHCYKPEMREKIREVMRYSGPRMIFHHPAAAIRHVILTKKEKKQIESKG